MPVKRDLRIAALFVAVDGCYFGLDEVEPWDVTRDARLYDGPHAVVAHPPCERWGRYWSGGPSARVRRKKGDDNGCFASALASVRRWGGVLEHPEASHAWSAHGLAAPPRSGGWVMADFEGGWTCCVEQGNYGHRARKATWLYAHGVTLPSLHWGPSECRARLDHGFHSAQERAAVRDGYLPGFTVAEVRAFKSCVKGAYDPARESQWRDAWENATGMKQFNRLWGPELSATPLPFRDLLLDMARTVQPRAASCSA